jgi:tetratricopeptide (TPR) repeat protein
MRRLVEVIVVSCWFGFFAAPLHAQESRGDEQARALFEAGKAAYAEGDYQAALEHFQRSYELSHRPQLQYNLGLAYDRLRQDEAALAAFQAYLDWDPKGERAPEVQARIAALKQGILARKTAATVAAPEASGQVPSTQPSDPDHDQHRKRRWWIAGASAVVLVAVGIAVGVTAGGSHGSHPREPNSGVRVQALSWQ